MRKNNNEIYTIIKDNKKSDLLRLARQYCEHGHSLLSHPSCLKKNLGIEDRIGVLDIESSGLQADYGYIFSYCIKYLNEDKIIKNCVKSDEIKKGIFDERLINDFIKDCDKFDKFITHYGTRFDIPFLRSRALYYNLEFPRFQEMKHVDTYFMAKFKLKLRSNRLQTICDFFNIPAKTHPMKPRQWNCALKGDQQALDYILTHNIEDVISTEEVYKKLINFVGPKNSSI
jgi:uncharacterized protein YprB with RNaseH-like and TPR domain